MPGFILIVVVWVRGCSALPGGPRGVVGLGKWLGTGNTRGDGDGVIPPCVGDRCPGWKWWRLAFRKMLLGSGYLELVNC